MNEDEWKEFIRLRIIVRVWEQLREKQRSSLYAILHELQNSQPDPQHSSYLKGQLIRLVEALEGDIPEEHIVQLQEFIVI